jgi:hypothetical protein
MASLCLQKLVNRLSERRISLQLADSAVEYLARVRKGGGGGELLASSTLSNSWNNGGRLCCPAWGTFAAQRSHIDTQLFIAVTGNQSGSC